MSRLYFAYGSNLPLAAMEGRCPHSKPFSAGTLSGYALVFGPGGYADVRPDPSGVVQGAVFEIEDEDLRRLDFYEGYPRLYTRFVAPIACDDCVPSAIVYRMVDDLSTEYALTNTQYLNVVLRGYADWGLSGDTIVDALKATKKHLNRAGQRATNQIMIPLVEEWHRTAGVD